MRHRQRLKTVLSVLVSIWYVVCGGVVVANALTQQNIYQLGINYFDLNNDSCSVGDSDSTGNAQTSDETQAQQIAGTFILGFNANTPKTVMLDLATKYHFGGMFLTNTKDAASNGFDSAFYTSLERAAGSGMFITSDEEGVVTRYDYGSTSFPSAGAMAKESDSDITAIGQAVGGIMANNGLDADLAPVLDLRDVGKGLDGRSFSSNPSVVADKAGAFATGLQARGITPIFKHFPGFDDTTSGSTDDQKVVMSGSISKTVAPYKTLLAKFPDAGVMLSNMYVTKLDKDNPSSLSGATVQYLRSDLNFNGLITTDDLSVNSVVNKAGSLPKAVTASLDAGVDMPLFSLGGDTNSSAEANLNKIIAAVQGDTAALAAVQSHQGTINKYTGSGDTSTSNQGANCCGLSATTLTGDDNQTKVWNYFVGKGLNGAATAGIMGNMSAESGFNPAAEQNPGAWEDMSSLDANHGGKGGVGLVQWDGGRRPAVIKYLQSKGLTDADLHKPSDTLLSGELDYVWKELNGPYKQSTLDVIQKDTDPGQAAYDFHKGYEGSSDSQAAIRNNRIDPAKAFYNKFNGAGGTSGSTSGGDCSQGPVDCTSAQGNAKIICAAKAYDTASYLYAAGPRNGPDWHKQCPTIGPSCKIDCSLLVTLAVYDAFKVILPGTDTGGERDDIGKYWKKISFSELQPGDIIQPESGHVEVVDHVDAKKGVIYTFGAHMAYPNQAKDVSPSSYTDNSGNLYLRFIGNGDS